MREVPMERARSRNRNSPKHSAPHASRVAHVPLRALPLAMLVVGLTTPGAIHAIGLDEIAQQSALGEPLRLVIPVLSNASDPLTSDEFAGECFKLVPPVAGDLPQLNSARVALEQRGGRAFVVLTTSYPMNEPIMRVAVQAGCRVSVSREYTVLLDPVIIEPPIAAKVPEAPAAVAAAAPAVAEGVAAPGAAVAMTVPERRPVVRTPAPRKSVASATRTDTVNRASRVAASPPPATPRPAKALAQPRLQVSRTIADTTTAPVSGAPPTAAAEREALRTIEEQTVVLQRQIAELSLAMERMQQDLVAARAAKAEAEKNARVVVEQAAAAATSPWVAIRAWGGVNWPLLVLIPALIALIAAALYRRRPVLVPEPVTAAQAAAFNRADLGEPSVPNPEAQRDREVVVASIRDRPRGRMIPPAIVDPIEPEKPDRAAAAATHYEYDPGINVDDMNVEDVNFDEEVRKAHEVASEYSVLEREEPGIVGRLTDSWGMPKAAAQLENYLLAPRRGGRELSRGAIEELKLLRSIALEYASGAGADMMVPRPRGGNGQLRLGGN
jgi:hypothetical protein